METDSMAGNFSDYYYVLKFHHRALDTILGDCILSLWILGNVAELQRWAQEIKIGLASELEMSRIVDKKRK